MNLGDLIKSFRVDAEDTVKPHLFADADLIRLFNEAEDEAAIRSRLLFDNDPSRFEFSLSAGDTVIALDPKIIEIESACLIDDGGFRYPLDQLDRQSMDRIRPYWRSEVSRPTAIIHDDLSLSMNSVVDANYTLSMDGYRLPLKPMESMQDTPEISPAHHRHLVSWVLFRAFESPDADILDPKKSEKNLVKFEKYFGSRPDASIRRKQSANRPHRNQCIW